MSLYLHFLCYKQLLQNGLALNTEQISCCSKSRVLQLADHLPVVDKGGHVRGGGGQRVPAVRPQVVSRLRNGSSRAVPTRAVVLLYQRRAGSVRHMLRPWVVTVPCEHAVQPQLHPHRVLLPVPPLGPEGDGGGGGGEGSNEGETNPCPSHQVAPACSYPGCTLYKHTLNLRGCFMKPVWPGYMRLVHDDCLMK